ncbi:MAG: hypothetical protein NZL96_03150 [Patescibacteria group bacterium]|nr:hypothetical protein [Patescibacteria group bacterium]
MDPRHKRRIKIVQELYQNEFFPQKKLSKKTKEILTFEKKIVKIIEKYILRKSIESVSKIDIAILKLAIFELLIEKKEPVKVIINEAVELGKEFGGEKSYAFINAILGKVVANQREI